MTAVLGSDKTRNKGNGNEETKMRKWETEMRKWKWEMEMRKMEKWGTKASS